MHVVGMPSCPVGQRGGVREGHLARNLPTLGDDGFEVLALLGGHIVD